MRNRIPVPIIFLLVLASTWCPKSGAQAPPVPPQELPAGAEVLNRGPVNEAFAEPATLEDQGGIVVPREPPPNIEEFPPEDRPMGNDYVWVPGYWSWDSDRNDFVWAGACWRVAPPGMYWVPGYWAQVSDGWEWVAGFWAPEGTRQIEYLPAPPPPEELEASSSPPDPADIWVPGCWYWARDRYVFRPGYWLTGRPDWVWVPSHYSWSPRGYVFVAGYWDLALDARGVMFAPIYFPPSVYDSPGFSYSPDVVIDLDAISGCFFAYPGYSHYFFGDYYDDSYGNMGIYPQFDCDRLHTWYDPIYEYDRWHYRRTDPQWDEHQRDQYDRYRRDPRARPPRTYRELQTRVGGVPDAQRKNVDFVRPFRSVVSQMPISVHFERIGPDARQKIADSGSDMYRFRVARGKWEAPASPPAVVPRPVRQGSGEAPPSRQERTQRPPTEVQVPNVSHQQAPLVDARHDVRVARPERVKVPPPPVVARERGNSGGAAYAAPPPPAPKAERAKETRQTRQGPKPRTK